MGVEREYGKGVNGTKRVCRCPKCKCDHVAYVLYIGPASKPPFYCQTCKHNFELRGWHDEHEPYQSQVRI